MNSKRRSSKLLAVATASALVFAACGSDDDDGDEQEPASTEAEAEDEATDEEATDEEATDEEATDEEATDEEATDEEASAETVMTVAFDISPDAVWSDGTPITVADIECTWQATSNTPTSITTSGYDVITSVEGEDKSVTINFSEIYAPYRDLFNYILPSHLVDDCNDVSEDFRDEMPASGRAYQIDSWSQDQLILVPNESYWGDDPANAERIVMVPRPENQVEALKAGEVDFIFPQGYAGLSEALDDPNITSVPGPGTFYEGFWFQQNEGPLADDTLRTALAKTIDRELVLANIYDPIFPGAELLNCGTWVPTIGNWCDQTIFEGYTDPEGAVAMLEEAGWTLNGEGLWENPDGEAPEIRWMINEPNPRRQDTQALLIPLLREAGFNVVSDNGDAATVFQQRLPALDYDMGMYISVATPDPSVTISFHCNQVPSEENDFQGQNSQGWCNEEASALMDESDLLVEAADVAAREDLIHQIGQFLADDAVMVPMYQFPNIAAWRTDVLTGDAPGLQAANYRAFGDNIGEWETNDGEIVVGAEQWPDCINPVTECANSSWMVWTATFPVLPAIFDTTGSGDYAVTDLLVAEPVVTVL